MKRLSLYVLLHCLAPSIYAQMSTQNTTSTTLPGLIPGYSQISTINTKTITYNYTLPPADPTPVDGDTTTEGNGAFYYGDALTLNAQLGDGNYTTTTLGKVWTLKILVHNAKNIGIMFGTFSLATNAEMYIYNISQTELIGPVKAENFVSTTTVASPPLNDSAIIVYILERNNTGTFQSNITIPQVLAGFRGFEDSTETTSSQTANSAFGPFGLFDASVNCDPGIYCSPSYLPSAKSVAIFINNGLQCTGTLINNDLNNGRAYFLTAFHCLDKNGNGQIDATELSSLTYAVVQFKYWRIGCGTGSIYSRNGYSGAVLRAAWRNSDFLLLELTNPPGIGDEVNYAGWNRQTGSPNDLTSYIIHHPKGSDMRITNTRIVRTYPFNGKFWQAFYSSGTTDKGSSGAAIFNESGQVVGQLKAGWSSCNFTDFSDRYGKFDASWSGGGTNATRLSDWLSPGGSNWNNPLILSPVSISGPISLQCDNSTATFYVPSITGCTYAWTVSNNINIISGQGTPNLVVTANYVQYAQGGLIHLTITDSKGINRVVEIDKNVVLGAPFASYISYAAHAGCGAYIFMYNGATAFEPPNRYYEAKSMNGVEIRPYPLGYPGTGLPPSTLYDQYGGGVTVLSGTAQVRVRYKNECGWSDWSSTFSLPSCGPSLTTAYVLSPNPTANNLTVSTLSISNQQNIKQSEIKKGEQQLIESIAIIDIKGHTVIEKKYSSQVTSATIDVSNLAAGIYIVTIFNGSKWTQRKFVKR